MMPDDLSRSHWNAAYESRTPEAQSWHQALPAHSLSLVEASGIAPEAPLIDVGGGASPLAEALLDRGYTDITVLDISDVAIREARTRLGMRSERVNWVCGDIRHYRPPKKFKVWHDRALFHFLTRDEDRSLYCRALRDGLAVGGCLILSAFAVGGPERCSGLDVVQYDESRLLAALGPGFELEESLLETHRTPAGGEQQFAWFRLRRS